jgi:NAD(P)-dependent dehydrogenase (short-subunit alcohol dehydrogenase family)
MSISEQQKPLNTGFDGKTDPNSFLADIDLTGKTALVTGGYSGIGLETVRALANAGAQVYVPARDRARAIEALGGIIPPDHIGDMDLADIGHVRRFAEAFGDNHTQLDILIANAGVMACPEQRTQTGWEWQIGVNHFGHFALLQGLLPLLCRAGESGQARVVTLSSIGHRLGGIDFDDMHYTQKPYEKWSAYGQSKTAKSLLAVHLDALEQGNGIRAFAVHPGGIFTPLQRHLANEEMVVLGWTNEDGTPSERAASFFKTPLQGAGTSLWCATAGALDGMGGVYCEDCDIAALVADDDASPAGVRGWAVDRNLAERLWQVTEKTLAAH